MKKTLLFLFYLSLPIFSIGQSYPIIEMDTITRQPKTALPFDKPFFLKIRADELPPYIDYLENINKLTWNVTISKKVSKNKSFTFNEIPKENYEIKVDNKIKYLFIKFDYHPYRVVNINKDVKNYKNNDILEPSKQYTLIIPKLYAEAIKIFDNIHENKLNEANNLIGTLKDSQLTSLGLTYSVLNTITEAVNIYDCKLWKNYLKIDSLKKVIIKSKPDSLYKNLFLKNILSKLTKCDTCLSIISKDFDLVLLRKITQNLYMLTPDKYSNLLLGNISFDDENDDPSKTKDNSQRVANLTKSLSYLYSLKRFTDFMIIRDNFVPVPNELITLQSLTNDISQNLKITKAIIETRNKISNSILDSKIYLEPTTVSGSSYIYNFETRSKLQITPDFGYVAYGFANGFSGFTPYVGFHINFRYIDKDIPFNLYPNKNIWHRLSFMTGWTLVSVSENGKRSDFFTKSSLLTGVGFRFTNAIRLTMGSMWFYRDDPNPIIEQKKLSTAFFTGLSIDLDIKKLLNGFDSLIPNK